MECQIKTSKRLSAIDLFTGSFFWGGGVGWLVFVWFGLYVCARDGTQGLGMLPLENTHKSIHGAPAA